MATETTGDDASQIAQGIEAVFIDQAHHAVQRRDEAYRWLTFWREKMQDAGATPEQADAAAAEAKTLIEKRHAERLDAIAAKRPETYAAYGLDCTQFDENGLPFSAGDRNLHQVPHDMD